MFSIQKLILSTVVALGLASWALAIDLTNSPWIYTPEHTSNSAPIGNRGFRKTIVAPAGKTALFADILIAADNRYVLHVNGVEVGRRTNNDNWWAAGRYCVGLRPGNNLFAVNVTNISLIAGLEFAAVIHYDDMTTSTVVSDTTWRTLSGSLPSGFEQPTFSDSNWVSAIIVNQYAGYPYSAISVPNGSLLCAAYPCTPSTTTVTATTTATTTVTVKPTVTSATVLPTFTVLPTKIPTFTAINPSITLAPLP